MKLYPLVCLSLALLPVEAVSQVSITKLKEFSYQREASHGNGAKIAFDGQFAYVSSPDGQVYRTPALTRTSPLTEVYAAHSITGLVDSNDTLYVLVGTTQVPENEALQHSLLQSTDHGASFVPIDAGLKACAFGYCEYLPSTEVIAENELLFVNAGEGRNLLVSANLGENWTALSGSVEHYVCTHSAFEITGLTVLQGGECPLDIAFLDRGRLQGDMLAWIPGGELKPTETPDLENRNVMAIKAQPNADVRLAGAEGAVLRSVDAGPNLLLCL